MPPPVWCESLGGSSMQDATPKCLPAKEPSSPFKISEAGKQLRTNFPSPKADGIPKTPVRVTINEGMGFDTEDAFEFVASNHFG